jgi:hypothetical protein
MFTIKIHKDMKPYSIYISLFFSFLLLFSCKKSDLITFKGDRVLYFSIPSADSVSVNFAVYPDDVKDSILKIPVGLLGTQMDADAAYNVVVDDKTTTAIRDADFQIPGQFNFLAKRSTDTVRVKISRSEKLSKGQYIVSLELQSGPMFNNTLFDTDDAKTRSRKVRIYITDVLAPTKNWANTASGVGTEYYMGRFSKKKIVLAVELFAFWSFQDVYNNIDFYPDYFGSLLNSYLLQQKAAGTPVLEDDGTLMEAGIYFK